jgi:hypothetical protein
MAHGISSGPSIRVHQALHGYADGHRLIASSVALPTRDAKTMLMMSDASGPGSFIDDCGYLTGYPLSESGYFAIGRTWDAPEMSRPGCVWTHTILIAFADLPALGSARALLPLFSRPGDPKDEYSVPLDAVQSVPSELPPSESDELKSLLFALYAFPRQQVIASSIPDSKRDAIALAIWDQQWPRLRRSFRFCTQSFADRSSEGAQFDLQFTPADKSARVQFKNPVDADRVKIEDTEWLRSAAADIAAGSGSDLRRFLKEAGGDASGREAFAPLSQFYSLSQKFSSDPDALGQAITIVEGAFSPSQGRATRASIVRAAAARPDTLTDDALSYLIRNWDLLDQTENDDRAEKVGAVLWARDPGTVASLLGEKSSQAVIAEKTIKSLAASELIDGLARDPRLIPSLLSLRPDLVTAPRFWSLRGVWDASILETAFASPVTVQATLSSMIDAGETPVWEVCRIVGREPVLRASLELVEKNPDPEFAASIRPWLVGSSEPNIVAKLLSDELVTSARTLEVEAEVVGPDFVTNDYGDDPWLTAWRSASKGRGRHLPQYLACFFLARGLGRGSNRPAELVVLAFDTVYEAAAKSRISDSAWRLLDDRLPSAYFKEWDRCRRIREGVVGAFVDHGWPPDQFGNLSGNLQIFESLVEVAAGTYRGRRYLREGSKQISASNASRSKYIEDLLG